MACRIQSRVEASTSFMQVTHYHERSRMDHCTVRPSQGGGAPSETSGRGGGRLNRATSASEESSLLGGTNVAVIKRGGATWAMQTWLLVRHWRVMCYQILASMCY